MTRDGFAEALRYFLRRSPFSPFFIELMGGTRLLVKRPEMLEPIGSFGLTWGYKSTTTTSPRLFVFDAASVSMISEPPPRPPATGDDFLLDLPEDDGDPQ